MRYGGRAVKGHAALTKAVKETISGLGPNYQLSFYGGATFSNKSYAPNRRRCNFCHMLIEHKDIAIKIYEHKGFGWQTNRYSHFGTCFSLFLREALGEFSQSIKSIHETFAKFNLTGDRK